MKRKFKRMIQFIVRPIKPFLKSRSATIRSGPAKGLKGMVGQWTIPFQDEMEDDFLRKLNFNGKMVYDVGANVGAVTLFLGKNVGEAGRVFAFEPHPHIVKSLHQNISLNKLTNISVHEIGIGEEVGEFSLIVPVNKLGSGSIRPPDPSCETNTYTIKVMSLDEFVSAESAPEPDFVKIDTEGFETEVLLGMPSLFKTKRPSLMLEMHGLGEDEKLKNATDVLNILFENNYAVLHLEHRQLLDGSSIELAKRGHLFACSTDDPFFDAAKDWAN